jgi:nitrous oxidase accessory protein NosD
MYLNSLLNNTMFQGSDNFNNNTWYHSVLGGNFWDDYQGIDENNDGFGDTSYIVDSKESTQQTAEDNLPLMTSKISI